MVDFMPGMCVDHFWR